MTFVDELKRRNVIRVAGLYRVPIDRIPASPPSAAKP